MKLLYEELIPENREDFIEKVREISNLLGILPDWLMLVFYIETAASVHKKIDHRIKNSIDATGLIQFLPSTARNLGTTTAKLREMSNVEQLHYVYKYLYPYRAKIKSVTDVYLAVFFPAAIGKPDEWILKTSGLSAAKIATLNPGFDSNKDGVITVGEIKKKVLNCLPKGYELC